MYENMSPFGEDVLHELEALTPEEREQTETRLKHIARIAIKLLIPELESGDISSTFLSREFIEQFTNTVNQLTLEHQDALLTLDDPKQSEQFVNKLTEPDLNTLNLEPIRKAQLLELLREKPRKTEEILSLLEVKEAVQLYEYKAALHELSQSQKPYKAPGKLYAGNTKLETAIFNGLKQRADAETGTDVALIVQKGKDPTCIKYQLICPEKGASYALGIFDRAVLGAVGALYNEGCQQFTNQNVANILAGKRAQGKLVEEVDQSIQTLQSTIVAADLTQHYKKIMPQAKTGDMMVRTSILPVTKDKLMMQYGKVVVGYEFYKAPPLLQYAQDMRQIMTANAEIMNVPDISNSRLTVGLKTYLMHRTEQAKNPHNPISATILFSAIYEALQINQDNRKAKQTIRDYTFSILKHWETIGYIQGHEVAKGKKGTYYSVTLIIDPDQKRLDVIPGKK